MPIYEYRCPNCGEKFDKLVRVGSDQEIRCPRCGNDKPRRLISIVARMSADAASSSPARASSSCATST